MIPRRPNPEFGIDVDIGSGQEQYNTIPARVGYSQEHRSSLVTTEWEPTLEELARLLNGSRIRMQFLTFGHPFHPMMVEVPE